MKKEQRNKQKVNKGFTLIELLVVVLIIGILAAIALPQYQLSVDKTKFAKLRANAKVVSDSYTRYYLLHNDYPSSFDELDINWSEDFAINKTSYEHAVCAKGSDFYCCMIGKTWYTPQSLITCGLNNYFFALTMLDPQISKQYYCNFQTDNKRAEKLCKTISKNSSYTTSDLLSPDNWISGHSSILIKE